MASEQDKQWYIDDMGHWRGYVLGHHQVMAGEDCDVVAVHDNRSGQ
jgi:hypothetical protein